MHLRLLATALLLVFLPCGLYTLYQAYRIDGNPHVFVMFIFSGSLMVLLGLVGLIGLSQAGKKAEPTYGSGPDQVDEIIDEDSENSAGDDLSDGQGLPHIN
jgi:hypothetical protein